MTGRLPTQEDGSTCIHLVDNKCEIYENRPEICRVDLMIDRDEDPSTRYQVNVNSCNFLQQVHGIDKSYRVSMEGVAQSVEQPRGV